jgi:TrmH family RNA methyltransferase
MVKISKARTKFIKSLQIKKYRQLAQTFIVEGEKSVREVLASDYKTIELYVTPEFMDSHAASLPEIPVHVVNAHELSAVSSFKSNSSALALVEMKENSALDESHGLFLVLDKINDPGNLGTVIRIADWYGVKGIIASEDTTDLYNPKVISASKGSFTRVPVYYTSLTSYLSAYKGAVFAAEMNGENVHETVFPEDVHILMGNESHGVSPDLKDLITKSITIPSFGNAESLNVGMATAIICDNIRRSG